MYFLAIAGQVNISKGRMVLDRTLIDDLSLGQHFEPAKAQSQFEHL